MNKSLDQQLLELNDRQRTPEQWRKMVDELQMKYDNLFVKYKEMLDEAHSLRNPRK